MSVLPSVCDIILKLYWFQQVKITAFKYDNIRQGIQMGNYNFLFHNSEKKHLNCEIKNSQLKKSELWGVNSELKNSELKKSELWGVNSEFREKIK